MPICKRIHRQTIWVGILFVTLISRIFGEEMHRSATEIERELARLGVRCTDIDVDTNGMYFVDLRGREIVEMPSLKGMPISGLALRNTSVTNLSFLEGLSLRTFILSDTAGTKISDISIIKGMPIERLVLAGTAVSNINVLSGMPLTWLSLNGSPVEDIRPLAGMNLLVLDLARTKVRDITPLKETDVEILSLDQTAICDLSPLAGKQIKELHMEHTGITNLMPLSQTMIREISFEPARIKLGRERLLQIKTLQTVTYWTPEGVDTVTAAAFREQISKEGWNGLKISRVDKDSILKAIDAGEIELIRPDQ